MHRQRGLVFVTRTVYTASHHVGRYVKVTPMKRLLLTEHVITALSLLITTHELDQLIRLC